MGRGVFRRERCDKFCQTDLVLFLPPDRRYGAPHHLQEVPRQPVGRGPTAGPRLAAVGSAAELKVPSLVLCHGHKPLLLLSTVTSTARKST